MKLKRIVISLNDSLLESIDKANPYESRAEFIRQCLKRELTEKLVFPNGEVKERLYSGGPAKKQTLTVKKMIEEVAAKKDIQLCKHGSMVGLCRFGCKD